MTLVCVSLLLSGCGGSKSKPTGTVSGKVTLNGKPLEGGSIVFFADGTGDSAFGSINKDGTYSLKHGKGTSVPAGHYRVALSPVHADGPAPDPKDLMSNPKKYEPNSIIPQKYLDASTSELVADVKAGSNLNKDFDLK